MTSTLNNVENIGFYNNSNLVGVLVVKAEANRFKSIGKEELETTNTDNSFERYFCKIK